MNNTTEIREQFRAMLINEVAPQMNVDTPIDVQRAILEAMGADAELPAGLKVEQDTLGGVPIERLTPTAHADRVVFYIHGGGFCMGSCASHRALAGRVAVACRAQAVVTDYRLGPEHPFPVGLEDLLAAYRALLEQGSSPKQIIFAGDSAGGGLVVSTALLAKQRGLPQPLAMVMLSPWLDLTLSGPTALSHADIDPWLTVPLSQVFVRAYGADPSLPLVSPLNADLSGLAPTLIHVGGQEILLSDSTRFEERARAAGVDVRVEVYEQLWHVWHLFAPALPDANHALAAIGEQVEAWFLASREC